MESELQARQAARTSIEQIDTIAQRLLGLEAGADRFE